MQSAPQAVYQYDILATAQENAKNGTEQRREAVAQPMITQIEIDGFKSFKNFKIELAPFQVIVGPNGSGKSNLFDALQLLSRLADHNLFDAFQGVRGNINEQFTRYPDGTRSNTIRIAVEMLVDRKMETSTDLMLKREFGGEAEVKYPRLRYEVEVALQKDEYGLEGLFVKSESLKSITQKQDSWSKKYGLTKSGWLTEVSEEKVFIETVVDTSSGPSTIHVYPDSISKLWANTDLPADRLNKTALNILHILSVNFLHLYAVYMELSSLQFLHLNPTELRKPSSTKAPRGLGKDGSNLATTLMHMQREDEYVMGDISREMLYLVPGLRNIQVAEYKHIDQYAIHAEMTDQRLFTSQVLSDGTLRLLALVMLKNDRKFRGVLCIEEPEDGVDPLHLAHIAYSLKGMATDFEDEEQVGQPLRQVLITTHSPMFIALPDVVGHLLFALKVTRIEPQLKQPMEVTRIAPVLVSDKNEGEEVAMEAYTIDQVKKYFDTSYLEEASERLNKARNTLHKG